MGSTTDKLVIKFETDGDGKVKASVAGLERGMEKVDRKVDKTSRSMGVLKKAIAAVGFIAATGFVVNTASAFEQLDARLITATGSANNAGLTFEYLRNLTGEMPVKLEELTDSYIKLMNLGLNPSREALISYGNTAAAQGKSLNQLIEAVADASTGEFERLKEFGIKSRVEGDRIKFIFRGAATDVGNSAEEIQNYLINIGNVEYAGAMDRQNDTLQGSFTDLANSIAVATQKLAEETGFTNALKDAARGSAEAIRYLSNTETLKDVQNQMKAITVNLVEYQERINAAREAGTTTGIRHNELLIKQSKSDLDLLVLRHAALVKLSDEYEKTQEKNNESKAPKGFDFDKYGATQEAALSKQYAELTKSLQSEEDRIKQSYQNRLLIVENAHASNMVSNERAAELEKQLEEQKQKALTEIAQREQQKRQQMAITGAQTIAGAFFTYTSSMLSVAENQYTALDKLATAAENNGAANAGALRAQADAAKEAAKRAFEENKKAQKANVVVNTASAIMRAYTDLPIWAAVPASLLLFKAGQAQLQAISSANYGGGTAAAPPIYTPGNPSGTGGGLPGNDGGANITYKIDIHDNYGWDDYIENRVATGLQRFTENDGELFSADSHQASVVNS